MHDLSTGSTQTEVFLSERLATSPTGRVAHTIRCSMVPPSAASYMRGMATGALLVAMMFGPEWIAHIQPVKAKGRHGSSVHLENLGIIYQLSSMFAQAAIGPSRNCCSFG